MQKVFTRLLHLGQNTFWQLLQDVNTASEEQLTAKVQELQQQPLHVWIGKYATAETASFLIQLQQLGLKYTEHLCQEYESEELETVAAEQSLEDTFNITCGFNETEVLLLSREGKGAWYNGVSQCACPWAALAEAAFAVSLAEKEGSPAAIDSWRICWLGEITPTSQSLMEAGVYVPFELFMGIPSWSDPDHSVTDMALKAGSKVFMTREPRLALDDAHSIYMDPKLESMTTTSTPSKPIPIFSANDNFVWEKGLALTETHLSYATKDVRIMTTNPHESYTKAEAELQTKRVQAYHAAFIIALHSVLNAE